MTTCHACEKLQEAVTRAEQAGDAEKARVMRLLYDQHAAQHKPAQVVEWANGVVWRVKP